MNDLRAITSSALLGTERSPLGTLENPHLEQARQHLEPDGQAKQLLGTAILAFNLTRAGQPANSKIPSVAPAVADIRPVIPEVAQDRLRQLLSQQADLIPEWLELANQAGFRVPHKDLIALLDYGRQHNQERQKILPLLDSRGRWLAQQNLHWAWATGDTSSIETALETWETGSKAARVLAFQAIRTNNPDHARGLLEQVWKSEPASERYAFLSELQAHLAEADEPFLETCLSDRSKDVRGLAAELLSRLANSQYVARMKTRARELIKIGKKELEVNLPEWSAELLKDAIDKTPPHGIGEKAYWWQNIVEKVPLEFWTVHLGLSPSEILKRLPKAWRGNFITTATQIVQRLPNSEWLEALLAQEKNILDSHQLLLLLPLERREAVVRQHVFAKDAKFDTAWLQLISHQWDLSLTKDVFEWIGRTGQKILANKNEYVYIESIAHHAHLKVFKHWQTYPEWQKMLVQLEQNTENKNRSWYLEHLTQQVKQLISTLETRAAMRKELQP